MTEAAPDVDGVALMQAYYLMNGGETAAMFQAYTDQTGRTVTPNDIELITWAIYQAGLHTTAADYSRSLGIWDRAAEAYSRFHETYDLLLTPPRALMPRYNHQRSLKKCTTQPSLTQANNKR